MSNGTAHEKSLNSFWNWLLISVYTRAGQQNIVANRMSVCNRVQVVKLVGLAPLHVCSVVVKCADSFAETACCSLFR